MQSLLFSFQGRVNRAKWWLVGIASSVVFGVVFAIVMALFGGGTDPTTGMPSFSAIGGILMAIAYIVLLWIGLAISVKRCHDRNRSGWFVLLGFVPIANIWYLIEVAFLKGTTGANQYGADPLAGT